MKNKSTDELNHEIKDATNIEDYLVRNKENMLTSNLPEYLNRLLTQKGLKRADVMPVFRRSTRKIP